VILGFDDTGGGLITSEIGSPVSDRIILVGLVGYGVCRFAAAFGFQKHPNVEAAAVNDPYLFIAGQTVPTPGFILIKGGVNVATHDVIIQHMAIYTGDCAFALTE